MRATIAAVVVALATSVAQANDGPEAQRAVRAKCERDWSDDFVMQKFCIEQQYQAAKAFEALGKMHAAGTAERRILERCFRQWVGSAFEKADFVMAEFCFDQQLEAYRELQE